MSKIEWTGRTWNPIAGCSLVSPGCTNCYAMRMAARLDAMGQAKYAGTTRKVNRLAVWTGKIVTDADALAIPLRTRKPTTWFVNSMSDLFHEGVPFDFVDRVFAVMALTPRHTYQILTKRPARMAEYVSDRVAGGPDASVAYERVLRHVDALREGGHGFANGAMIGVGWPLRNVWLGCSPVNQKTLDEYLPHLLRCDAAVRFLSLEPLLGPVVLPYRIWCRHHRCYEQALCMDESKPCFRWQATTTDMLDWIIVGGESGPGARPFETGWARSIVHQCHSTGIRCFVKQLGSAPFASDWEGCSPPMKLKDRKGGDPSEWPEDLRVREMPAVVSAANQKGPAT